MLHGKIKIVSCVNFIGTKLGKLYGLFRDMFSSPLIFTIKRNILKLFFPVSRNTKIDIYLPNKMFFSNVWAVIFVNYFNFSRG